MKRFHDRFSSGIFFVGIFSSAFFRLVLVLGGYLSTLYSTM